MEGDGLTEMVSLSLIVKKGEEEVPLTVSSHASFPHLYTALHELPGVFLPWSMRITVNLGPAA